MCGNYVPDVAQVAFWTANDLGFKIVLPSARSPRPQDIRDDFYLELMDMKIAVSNCLTNKDAKEELQ